MPKNKPLNFEGASLKSGGGSVSNGVYTRNFWRVILADGTEIQRNHYGSRPDSQFTWERWWPNGDERGWPHTRGWFRKLGDFDNAAVDAWVKSHPDYYADGTRKAEIS